MDKNKSLDNGGFISKGNTEAKAARKEEKKKETAKKNNKPNFFKRIGAKVKDVFSELKKVSWPTFAKVVKETGVVLVVVLVFVVIIAAFDLGLDQLLLFITNLGK